MKNKGRLWKSVLSFVLCTAMVAEPCLPLVDALAAEREEQLLAEEQLKAELAAKSDRYPDGGYAFYEDSQSVDESAGELILQVVRYGSTEGEDTVELRAADFTTFYGQDYEIEVLEQTPEETAEEKVQTSPDNAQAETETEDLGTEMEQGTEVLETETEAAETEAEVLGTEVETESEEASVAEIYSLSEAKAAQTGVVSDQQTWREASIEPTDAQLAAASMEAENEIINAMDGQNFQLKFADGEYKKTVRVKIIDDDLSEGSETAILLLGNVQKGMLAENNQFELTITDNEPDEEIHFAMAESELLVASDEDVAKVKIQRTSGVNYYASAIIYTSAISATPGGDYVPLNSREIVFAAGETEKIIEIALTKKSTATVQFSVNLDSTQTPVEEGRSKTVVTIQQQKEDSAETDAEAQMYYSSSATETINGIEYTVYEYKDFRQAAVTEKRSSSGWKYYVPYYFAGAARANVKYKVSGNTEHWYGTYYNKKSQIYLGGRVVSTHDISDRRENNSLSYNESFSLDAAQRVNGYFKYMANSYTANQRCYVDVSSLKLYYPTYQVSFDNSNAAYKPKTYSSAASYQEASTSVQLGSVPASRKLSKDNSIYIGSSCIKGAYVSKYEIYAGDKCLGSTTSSWLSYSSMNEYLNNSQWYLQNDKFQITIKPVYEKYEAKVLFQCQDSSMANYASDTFTHNQILTCTVLDSVKITAQANQAQQFKISSVELSGYSQTVKKPSDHTLQTEKGSATWKADSTTKYPNAAEKMELTFSVTNNYNYITINYQQPTITVKYDESEVQDTKTASAGAVFFDTAEGESAIRTAGDYKNPITLKSGVSMTTPYMVSYVPGEEALAATIPYKALWTYTTQSGDYKTVIGDSYVFTPYYADTFISYYFKQIQKDVSPVGVSGTVKVKETPLFMGGSKASTLIPASGVVLNIGGQRVTTNSKGEYKTENVFNKGEYVGVYMQYDSAYMVDQLDISKNRVYNPVLNINSIDQVTITNTVIKKKFVDEGSSLPGLPSGVETTTMSEVASIYLEDAEYELSMNTRGAAGVIPARAEFRFYDESGNYKSAYTQTVSIGTDGKVVLKLNPMSVPLVNQNGAVAALSAGDMMMVKVFDSNGNGYYEHHTNIVLTQQVTSMYMFNYNAIKQESDNAFIKAIGGISMGYDLAIDAMTNSFGDYVDDEGKTHHLCGIGFGKGFGSTEGTSYKVTDTARRTRETVINDINIRGTSDQTFIQHDDFSMAGGGDAGSWSLDLQIGVIMDTVRGDGTHGTIASKWYFNDYVMLGKVSTQYKKTWDTSIGPVSLQFTLAFTAKDSGVQWYFSNEDAETKYAIGSDSTINMLESKCADNAGSIDLNATVKGDAYIGAGSGKAFFGIGGEVKLETVASFAYNQIAGETGNSWKNDGIFSVQPAVKLKLSIIQIPLWTKKFEWTWGTASGNSVDATGIIEQQIADADMLEVATAEPVVIDRNYLSNASAWNGTDGAGAFSIADAQGVSQNVLKEGIFSESKIKLQQLGEDSYIAVFTDDIASRDAYNRAAVCYTIYDGTSWSEPVVIEDDGTNDDIPVIADAGDRGYLIAWSDAARALTEDDSTTEVLNQYNITGVFFDPDTLEMGDPMQITKNTAGDAVADSYPQIAYYDSGTEKTLMVYYTKSEYAATDEQAGETVGDILSPYTVLAYRTYDFTSNTWSDTYTDDVKTQIMGSTMTEQEYETYVQNYYGQQFLSLAPVINIEETIDPETKRWQEGTTPTITAYNGLQDPVVTDTAVIAYNELALNAYVMDEDGSTSTSQDSSIYLQIYNMQSEEVHHPIRLTTERAKMENLQFVRANDVTYLYWLEDGVVMSQNISNLVKNCLLEGTTEAGQKYYYIDRSSTNEYYEEAGVIAEAVDDRLSVENVGEEQEITEEGGTDLEISGFSAYANDDYIYTVWTQVGAVPQGETDMIVENQLYICREELNSHEMTEALQITNDVGAVYQSSDFAVNPDGTLQAIATRFFSDEEDQVDYSAGQLVALKIEPKDAVTVSDVTYGMVIVDGEGSYIPATVELENSGLETLVNGRVTAEGVSGAQKITLAGGEHTQITVNIPVDKYGNYESKLEVEDGKSTNILCSEVLAGTAAYNTAVNNFEVTIQERDKLSVHAEVVNESAVVTPDAVLKVGYYDADGKQQELYTKKLGEIEARETIIVDGEISVKFADIYGKAEKQEDGTYKSSLQFYAETTIPDSLEVFDQEDLIAYEGQLELMEEINAVTPVLSKTKLSIDDGTYAMLSINGDEAVNPEELGLKVMWLPDSKGIVDVKSDYSIQAVKSGTTTLKGYVMPQDTDSNVQEDAGAAMIDNYPTLPNEAIREVSINISVDADTIDISKASIAAIGTQIYTGKALTPSVTVTYDGKTLIKDTDYTVSYKSNTDVGTAEATITGKGSYTGTKTITFAIKKAMSKTKAATIGNKVYTGKAQKPSVKLTYGGKTLKKNTDYTITYKSNKAIGTASIVLKGKGDYTGTKTVTFKIVPAKPSVAKLTSTLKLSWKKVTGAKKYEICYATKKKGSYKLLTTTSKTNVNLSNQSKLKKGKTYYVKVRAYKVVGGKKIYGSYSAVRKVQKK